MTAPEPAAYNAIYPACVKTGRAVLFAGVREMLETYEIDREAMLAYAEKWAFGVNPDFYDFSELGGDCTNFVSQCIYAGGAVMNYTPDLGWYYISLSDRAAAWTGVEFFAAFMLGNKSAGPFGVQVPLSDVEPGDVVQLGTDDGFYHSLLVTGKGGTGGPLVTAHTFDVYNRPLSEYSYRYIRCIHIIGARRWV